MFFDKNKKIKKRLELEQLKEDLLVSDFILKMKEHNINLYKSETKGNLFSYDILHDTKNSPCFFYYVNNGKLVIDYNQHLSLLEKIFRNYYNISVHGKQINVVNKGEIIRNKNDRLYIEIVKSFKEMHNNYIAIYINRAEDDFSSVDKPISGSYRDVVYANTIFPRIVFKEGVLYQELVLSFLIKDSPFLDLSPNEKNIIVNIIDQEDKYEVNVYIESFSIKLETYVVGKEIGFEKYSQQIINIIKSLGLTKLGKEVLDIENRTEFNNEKAETLKMMGY